LVLVFLLLLLEGLGYLVDDGMGVGVEVLVISTPELDEVFEMAVESVEGR